MPDSLQEITSAVHQSTLRTVQGAWPPRGSGPALMDLTEASLNHLDSTLAGFTQIAGLKTVCAAGCFFCCYLPIDVRAHEVFLILRWLDANWSVDAVSSLLEDLRRIRALPEENRAATRLPCVFLIEGKCSIHPARPGACRRYFSASVAACGDLYEGKESQKGIQYPLLKETGRAAGTAINNTFIAKGYDGFSYQLPLALASALEDPSCWERWLNKEKAFPSSAESILPPTFSQAENLARLQAALRAPAPTAAADPIADPAADPATAATPFTPPPSSSLPITPAPPSRTWNQSLSSTSPPQGHPAQKKPADSA